MEQIIIHVDMDAFYASVEIRDDPSLKGKPLIIGAMPDERGVVSTCSYEAREFGVRSGMNIKEAYRLCPQGIYMHPDFRKYWDVSEKLHAIWDPYATSSEPIALDETYLDVTETAGDFDRAIEMAHEIKKRTLDELGLVCSIGVAYSKSAAKTASEETKPNGFFVIRTREDFVELMRERNVRELFSVGPQTAKRLESIGITKIGEISPRRKDVESALGKQGSFLVDLSQGIDDRKVVAYNPEDAKSVSRELTFQKDTGDYVLIMDLILLLAMSVEKRASDYGHTGGGVQLKVTYSDMKSITRSMTGGIYEDALSIAKGAWELLRKIPRRPIRLVGVGVFNFNESRSRQTTLFDEGRPQENELDHYLERMHRRYNFDFVRNKEVLYRGETLHGIAEHMRLRRDRTR